MVVRWTSDLEVGVLSLNKPLSLCCFLRQEALFHSLSLPRCINGFFVFKSLLGIKRQRNLKDLQFCPERRHVRI